MEIGCVGVEDGTVIFQANSKIIASYALQTGAYVMLRGVLVAQEKRIMKIRDSSLFRFFNISPGY